MAAGVTARLALSAGRFAAAALVLVAFRPVVANANTYCVAPATGCTVDYPDVQTALDAATMNPGPDEVRIGAGSFTGNFVYNGNQTTGNDVTILGAGRSATTLTSAAAGSVLTTPTSAPSGASTRIVVRDLAVHIRAFGAPPAGSGIYPGIDTLIDVERVNVTADAGLTSGTGIAGTVRDVDVKLPIVFPGATTSGTVAVAGTVENSVLSAGTGAWADTARHLRITAGEGIRLFEGGVVDDVQVRLAPAQPGVASDRAGVLAECGQTTIRHLTVLGDGAPGSIGVISRGAEGDPAGCTATTSVASSILRGVATSYVRDTGVFLGPPYMPGTANLTISYSNLDSATGRSEGQGTLTVDAATNINADPLFADVGGDLNLRYGSPSIDRGDDAPLGSGEPTTDLAGEPRVADGDGAGGPRADMGAFEYQRRPPVVNASASPTSQAIGLPFSFKASATDPDPGDTLGFAWSFDEGGTASTADVSHSFTTPGAHMGTVTVTDPAGLTASATAGVSASQRAGAARLTRLSLRPKTFRAANRGPSAQSAVRRAPTGTRVSFSLSVRGRVRFTVQRQLPGRRRGRRCVAPNQASRSARPCRRLVRLAGSFSRPGDKGTNRFRFTGRIGRHSLVPGAYRLVGVIGSSKRQASFRIVR